ncbi:MAG: phosphatidylserine decarboxylase [Gammaproteobacteria bacterium]|nr:phosphatidylserine decarboxylase [Gammaproteobacteria bacterium]
MRWFARHYQVDMSEALYPDFGAYPNFNSFFTRALRPESRPITQVSTQICCPVDGTISQFGKIQRTNIFQAKQHTYSLVEILGDVETRARPYIDGQFATMYLSPGDYHRSIQTTFLLCRGQ